MLIGELVKRTEVSRDTVRLYERKGFIQSRPVMAGTRFYNDYPEDAVQIIKDIRQARLFGASLKEWKAFYDKWTKPDLPNSERYTMLNTELDKVQARLKQLQRFEQVLIEKMRQYQP